MKRTDTQDFDRALSGWKGFVAALGIMVVARLVVDVIQPGWLESLVGWERELSIMFLAIIAAGVAGWWIGIRRWDRSRTANEGEPR